MYHRVFTALAVSAALTFAAFSFAEQSSSPSGGGTASGSAEPRPRIELLDFPGGSVSEYVQQIRQTMPEANFALTADAEQFLMPPMTLRNVPIAQLAELITATARLPEGQGDIGVRPIGDVYAVQASIYPPRRAQRPQPEPLVMSLADIVSDDMPAEDVLSSIETALEVFGGDYPPASIRYHAATRLLIARGHPEQMGNVSEVIQQLRLARPRPAALPGGVNARFQAHEEVMERLQRRIAELDAALAELRENE